jgi:hypothetical protein
VYNFLSCAQSRLDAPRPEGPAAVCNYNRRYLTKPDPLHRARRSGVRMLEHSASLACAVALQVPSPPLLTVCAGWSTRGSDYVRSPSISAVSSSQRPLVVAPRTRPVAAVAMLIQAANRPQHGGAALDPFPGQCENNGQTCTDDGQTTASVRHPPMRLHLVIYNIISATLAGLQCRQSNISPVKPRTCRHTDTQQSKHSIEADFSEKFSCFTPIKMTGT